MRTFDSSEATDMNAKDTRISLDRYAAYGETVVARRIVRLALERGWLVSVYDGEEETVTRSGDRMAILAALATTEADWLAFHGGQTHRVVGRMMLVWGNDPSGDELIAEYTVDGTADSAWVQFINEVEGN